MLELWTIGRRVGAQIHTALLIVGALVEEAIMPLVGKRVCKCGVLNVTLHPGETKDWHCYKCKALLEKWANPHQGAKPEPKKEEPLGGLFAQDE